MKRLKASFPEWLTLAFLALLLSLFSCPSAYASGVYLAEPELQRMEQNLDQLSTLNTRSQRNLEIAERKLRASEERCATLETRLAGSEAMSNALENSLKTANESLQKQRREEKAKLDKAKRQRNIAYVLLTGMAIARLKHI